MHIDGLGKTKIEAYAIVQRKIKNSDRANRVYKSIKSSNK